MTAAQEKQRARRNSLLRLAIVSSGVSKITALGLQALAIPLVYRGLGSHQYALYLLLSAVLATVALVQMGAGPGLTQQLARAAGKENHRTESDLFVAALIFTGSAGLVSAILVYAIVHATPAGMLFGQAFIQDRLEILHVGNVCAFLLALQILMGVVDSALAGYQEQVFTSTGSAIANVASTAILILVCHYSPSITEVMIVLYGLPATARVVNLFLLIRRRPYLLSSWKSLGTVPIGLLMHSGLAFWVMQIAGILEQHAGVFLLAHLSNPESVSVFGILYKTTVLAGSAVGMVTQPLWPSLTDAIVRQDVTWIKNTYCKVKVSLLIYAITAAGVLVTAGPWLTRHLLKVSDSVTWSLLLLFAIYLIANTWTHLHYITLIGIGGIWRIVAVLLAENLLMIAFGLLLVGRSAALGMIVAYILASAALPAWTLPKIFQSTIQGLSRESLGTNSPVLADSCT